MRISAPSTFRTIALGRPVPRQTLCEELNWPNAALNIHHYLSPTVFCEWARISICCSFGRIVQLGCPQLDAERFYAGLPDTIFYAALLELVGLLLSFLRLVKEHRSRKTSTTITSSPSRARTFKLIPGRLSEMEDERPILAHQHCRQGLTSLIAWECSP